MPLRFPLRIRRFRGVHGEVAAIIISDASGQSINLCCDPNQLRRDAAHLWPPEEAEALAKWIARAMTDEWAVQTRIAENSTPGTKRSGGG